MKPKPAELLMLLDHTAEACLYCFETCKINQKKTLFVHRCPLMLIILLGWPKITQRRLVVNHCLITVYRFSSHSGLTEAFSSRLELWILPVYWVFPGRAASQHPVFILPDSSWWLVSSFLNSTSDRCSSRADAAEQEPDADRSVRNEIRTSRC